jgi:hypothetical protein
MNLEEIAMADGSFESPDQAAPFIDQAGLSQLLDLFGSRLAEVKFPGVDSSILSSDAEAVRRCVAEVGAARAAHLAAEAALAGAEAALVERSQALLSRAQRALAYALVFADGDAALRAELERIALPGEADARASDASTPSLPGIGFRKRGRPRKPRSAPERAPSAVLAAPPGPDACKPGMMKEIADA